MLNSRNIFSVCLIALFCQIGCKKVENREMARPNIVFILADDMGYGDPTCYNPQSKIPTPHIDRLAAEGMRFTNAHAPGAWCTPTRYGLMTGRYPIRTDLQKHRVASQIEPGQTTIASLLAEKWLLYSLYRQVASWV